MMIDPEIYDDLPPEMKRALENARKWDELAAAEPERAGLALVDPSKLAGIEPPDREWLIEDWLPVGTVTSLYAPGGTGKSLVAQQAATSIATGGLFFGVATTRAPVLVIAAEDDGDEMHRRQKAINTYSGVKWHDLSSLRWAGRFGEDNIVAISDGTIVTPTELYADIRDAAKKMGARLVVFDNIAQVFAGNENVRSEVTQFVNLLGRLARDINGAVLLIGHTGKGESAREWSGSTAWDAAVRSRWILERPQDDEDGPAADTRILRRAKANYAATGDEIALEWHQGCFRTHGMPARGLVASIEANNRERDAESAFMAELDELRKAGKSVSDSTNAANYLGKVMPGRGACKGFRRREIEQAVDRLFAAGRIRAGGAVCRRADRKWRIGIAKTEWIEDAERSCATVRHGAEQGAPGCATVPEKCATVPNTVARLNPYGEREKEACATVPEKGAPRCATAFANPLENKDEKVRHGAPHSVPISKDIDGRATDGPALPDEGDDGSAQVATLLASGSSLGAIARRTGVSVPTVDGWRQGDEIDPAHRATMATMLSERRAGGVQ